jgi:hypothetical protein
VNFSVEAVEKPFLRLKIAKTNFISFNNINWLQNREFEIYAIFTFFLTRYATKTLSHYKNVLSEKCCHYVEKYITECYS